MTRPPTETPRFDPFPGCAAVVIGGSAGGSAVLRRILRGLPRVYPLPIIVVQHLHPDDDGMLAGNLDNAMALPVVEALDKMPVQPGHIHVAPADYHLLVERGRTLALSVDEPVRFSRPSIDLCFQSAAIAFGPALLAILLTGANDDGTDGLRTVRNRGGRTVAQDPATAPFLFMPQAAIDAGAAQWVLTPDQIAATLARLGKEAAHGSPA